MDPNFRNPFSGVDVSAGASSSGGAGASTAEGQARSSSSGTQAGGRCGK